MRWTHEQEDMLVENANRGAEFCRDLIASQFGIHRSVEATRRHANRLGVITLKIDTCPHCGQPTRKLNKLTGLCATCNMKELAQKQHARNTELLAQARKTDGGRSIEFREAKREYDRERQANGRLRKKLAKAS